MQSQLLRINSKFRNDPLNTTTTNFTYSIPGTQSTESVKRIELVSFNCNRLFYNIATYNNTIVIQDGFGANSSVQLNPGHYSIETLIVDLNRVCNYTASGVAIQLTWSIVGDRLQVIANNVFLVTPESTIGPYIGLVGRDFVVGTTAKLLPSLPQLQYPDPIYVQSYTICSGGCLDSALPIIGGLIPLAAAVPTNNTPYGFNISWQKQSPDAYFTDWPQGVSLRTVDIRLCDSYGNLVELPGPVDVDLIFRLYF